MDAARQQHQQQQQPPITTDNNNEVEEFTIVSRSVEKISFLRSVTTQSDWQSRLMRETWYGHHHICARMVSIALIASTIAAIGALIVARELPIMGYLTTAELSNHSINIDRCLLSLCDTAQDLELACIINDDGKSAHVDFDSYTGPDIIPLTPICIQIFKEVFGVRNVSNLLDLRPGTVVEDEDSEEGTTKRDAAFQIPLGKCELMLTSSDGFGIEEMITLVNFTENSVPGSRVENVLEQWVCPDQLSEEIRDFILPNLQSARDAILRYRHILVVFVMFSSCILVRFANTLSWMPTLLFTTLLLRWNFTWPKDYVGRKQITFWSTWCTLLLLCFLTDIDTDPVTPFILLMGALYYRNWRAVSEWAFLTFLLYNLFELAPLLDGFAKQLTVFDGLGILRFGVSLVSSFIPGNGWWKLVFVYTLWRSFPRSEENVISKLHQKPANKEL